MSDIRYCIHGKIINAPEESGLNCPRRCTQEASVAEIVQWAGLRDRIEALLPWIDRTTHNPVAMWVQRVSVVASEFEPYPIGTPCVDVCAVGWDAADAVRDALFDVGRIDEATWTAGWRARDGDVKEIRIYPEHNA